MSPESELGTYMVIDTNILLHQFEAIRTFVEDVEKTQLPVLVVVAGVVIYEIDGCVYVVLGSSMESLCGGILEKIEEI